MPIEKSKQKPSSFSGTLIYFVTLPFVWLYNLGVKPVHSERYKVAYFVVKLLVITLPILYVLIHVVYVVVMLRPIMWEDHESHIKIAIDTAQCPVTISTSPDYLERDLGILYYFAPDVSCQHGYDEQQNLAWRCTCKKSDS